MKQTTVRTINPQKSFLPVIASLFVGVLLLSNILASKMVHLGPFVFDGGTLLFPLSYIFGDVLTEVYGYKDTRKVIWSGLVMLVIMAFNIWFIGLLPADSSWTFQRDYNNILLIVPRIVLASILAYFVGEYINSVVLSALKVKMKGRHLWFRMIGSTVAGQLFDSALFVFIAFLGHYPFGVLVVMFLSNYLFKTVIEALFTPLTYMVISFVKAKEQLDVYDNDVNYNPFPID